MGSRPKNNRNGGKRGVAKWVPTAEMVDVAKSMLGRMQYQSRVSLRLQAMFEISDVYAQRVIDAARQQVIDALQGQGHDPMSAAYLFLQSVVADEYQPMRERIGACREMIRMLGMDRIIKAMGSSGVDQFLARVAGQQMARNAIPIPITEGEPE